MAMMPGAAWQGAHHDNGTMTRYDIVCIHTIVGYAPAHAAHLSTKANGEILQSRDTVYRSAANLNGNHRIIAIENEDHGAAFGAWSGSNVPAFTAAQIEANARICAWAYHTHGIPLVQCPDSRPTSRGIAFHRQGIDGNFTPYNGRVSGGEVWSSSTGKVCPGDRRIAQMAQIITRARQIAGLEQGDSMDMNDPDANALANRVWSAMIKGEDQRTIGSGAPETNTFVVDMKSAAGRTHAMMRMLPTVQWGPASAPVAEPNLLFEFLQGLKADLLAVKAGVAGLSDDESVLLAAIQSVHTSVLALADGSVDESELAALLALALAPLIQLGITEEQVESAMRRVFASAAQPEGN